MRWMRQRPGRENERSLAMISRLMLQPRRSLLALMAAPFLALAMLLWAAVPAGATAVTTELVSVSSTGQQGNSDSAPGSISPDGRFVGFDSLASNLVSRIRTVLGTHSAMTV